MDLAVAETQYHEATSPALAGQTPKLAEKIKLLKAANTRQRPPAA